MLHRVIRDLDARLMSLNCAAYMVREAGHENRSRRVALRKATVSIRTC